MSDSSTGPMSAQSPDIPDPVPMEAPKAPVDPLGDLRRKFGQKTAQIADNAKNFALEYKHTHIAPEHMLLGMLKDEGSGGGALFIGAEADPDQIRQLIKHQLRPGNFTISESDLTYSERGKRVLQTALEESRREGQDEIHPKHLLLGMLAVDNTVCSAVLRAIDLNPDNIRNG